MVKVEIIGKANGTGEGSCGNPKRFVNADEPSVVRGNGGGPVCWRKWANLFASVSCSGRLSEACCGDCVVINWVEGEVK